MKLETTQHPEKTLMKILPKKSGRNNTGKITARHIGGRQKRYYREIDFKRQKLNVTGKVVSFEYDPNRNVQIALINYSDGDKRYILAPLGLQIGDRVVSGSDVELKPGNCLPVVKIPVGTPIHNIELHEGKGGQLVRGAGSVASILAKEEKFVHVKLPSGEVRKIANDCLATIGQLANVEWKSIIIGSAGRNRRLGVRPKVRGTAQNPRSHPHGGGEGRSGEGMHPKTPWGKPARGTKTRKRNKYSNKYIIQKRK
ncbi:50S ribosomal protein L2 [Candidatus Gottesmanbacteria bacterium RIFCSPHIGHO2_02_FULL_40_13]|uniref:Large ribosomal subunit protein uL2 n=1 Tax=Candidatus Gottesmanbacteria bacterium RIFCSPHIGHO2_02_FULL_40_13 TaxID=1798384 RepID=A0A1F6A7A5_9BACT|nr:MAG: 50S ribosomal protein L2 [Candidatus Gottesmanbacteria bacterium RIFCSPHIGHO2_02_FULL_40_13]